MGKVKQAVNDKVILQIGNFHIVEQDNPTVEGRSFILAKTPQEYTVLSERRMKEELDDLVDRLLGHSDRVK